MNRRTFVQLITMPNEMNVQAPFLVCGAGRTASSYVLHILHSRGDTQTLVENTVLMGLRQLALDSWWSRNWPHECTADELERRLEKLARFAMTTLFPSSLPFWSYKAIWEAIDWDFYERVYPAAKYLHLVRDPRTNIRSMMDFIRNDRGRSHWTLEYSSKKYLDSNKKALEVRERSLPYLRIRQEDFIARPQETWGEIFDFLQLPYIDLPFTTEVNTSQSTVGQVHEQRATDRLAWSDLPVNVQALAQTLGYSRDSPS